MLFTSDFVRSIERLRIVARRVSAGGHSAEHRARIAGTGMEFVDYRSYAPGDDVRRIDWNLYQRSGRLFLRLFNENRDLPVYILLDTSDSMYFEAPPRADAARRVAAVLTAVSLNQFDRPAIYPFGADLVAPLRSLAGRQGLPLALRFLEGLSPAGSTDLARSLGTFGAMRLRSGLAVVISDFFDPRGPEAVTGALRSLRHRLVLVQLARTTDAAPPLDGALKLVDCESGATIEVTADKDTLQRYRQAYEAFNDELAAFAAAHGCARVTIDADADVLAQLRGLFENNVLMV
jgi:uncharacterized protein (DUF58 family)